MTKKAVVPEGFKEDDRGRLVPLDNIDDIDLQRDALVQETVQNAKTLNKSITHFKQHTSDDIQAFVELSAEQYGVTMGGKKGNINLLSFDGKYKVTRAIADLIAFDERLQVAKELVDSCLLRWAENANSNLKVAVQEAFQTDKKGNVNSSALFRMMRWKIEDSEWQKAMLAIKDSIQITGSKSYIRMYERQADGSYKAISLDIASV